MTTATKAKRTRRAKKTRAEAANARSGAAASGGWKLRGAGGLKVLEAPALATLTWLTHGFSTRLGGESEPPAAKGKSAERVLNLGFTDWDERERVLANREKFSRALGAEKMCPVVLRQIHSDIAYAVTAERPANGEAPKADALFTREPGALLVVQTADCVPILLADTKRRAVAAVHSGWRGT